MVTYINICSDSGHTHFHIASGMELYSHISPMSLFLFGMSLSTYEQWHQGKRHLYTILATYFKENLLDKFVFKFFPIPGMFIIYL